MAIVVNKSIPEFEANATNGVKVSNTSHLGHVLVLYFYPKDNTPGCTTEGLDFSRLYPEFESAGAVVLGVSRDSLKSHANFKCKQGFPFELLSDADEKLCEAFGVIKLKKMYGKEVRGIERSTFVFAADGRFAREWRGVKLDGHAQEVLDYVRSL